MPSIVVAKQGRRKWRKERHASLDKFRAKFGKRLGEPVIPYTKDLMEKDGILHLPLYMAMFL